MGAGLRSANSLSAAAIDAAESAWFKARLAQMLETGKDRASSIPNVRFRPIADFIDVERTDPSSSLSLLPKRAPILPARAAPQQTRDASSD
jgi:hypothetical protein